MIVCKNCGTRNTSEARSCKKCNHILPAEGIACPNCSNINGPYAKHCKKCGYGLTEYHKQFTYMKRNNSLFWIVFWLLIGIIVLYGLAK